MLGVMFLLLAGVMGQLGGSVCVLLIPVAEVSLKEGGNSG